MTSRQGSLSSLVVRQVLPVLALVGLGYVVFLAFVQGILKPNEFAGYGLVLTAIAAGMASFFSPCSFVVLPGYVAFASGGGGDRRGTRQAVLNGLAAASGVVTAVAVIGLVIAALGAAVGPELSLTGSSPIARVVRIVVGTFVIGMGVLHFSGLSSRLPLLGQLAAWGVRHDGGGAPSRRSLYVYGSTYVLVGIGCVGPFLAAVAAFALATGGFLTALAAFLLFAGVMGILMVLVSVLVGTSRNALLTRLRSSTHRIQRGASVVLILVGAGLIITTINAGAFLSFFVPA